MFGFGIAMEIVRTVRSIQPGFDVPTSVVIDNEYREVPATHMECRHAVGFLFLGFRWPCLECPWCSVGLPLRALATLWVNALNARWTCPG